MSKLDRSNRWLLLVLPLAGAFVALLLLLKGLSTPPPTPAPPTSTPDRSQEVIARVGERHITMAEWTVAYRLDVLMSRLSGQPFPPAGDTLDRLVNDTLILEAAAGEGIAPSEADIEARIALLEASWKLTDEQVAVELAAIGLTREMWAETIAHLLTVERYLAEMVWADVPSEGQDKALAAWLEARRARVGVEIDTHDLQPSLPTSIPLPTGTSVAALPAATPTATLPTRSPLATSSLFPSPTSTSTPLAVSPLATSFLFPSPTPVPADTPALVSPLPTPVVSPRATPGSKLSIPSGVPVLGQPAPDFSLADANGLMVRLSDYRDQRRVVIVFFRTTG